MSPSRPSVASRLAELLLVGGATPLLFALSWLLRRALGLDLAELAVGFTMFHAAHVINDPHFAVTYLLFYKDVKARAFDRAFTPSLRLRYLFAGFVAPAALALWAICALSMKSAATLGLMIQLMFFLVGWHYVKQGFGVMMVLSARRGVRYTPAERLVLLFHCLAGWAYAWSKKPVSGKEVEEKGVVYTSLVIPSAVESIARLAFVITIVLLLATLIRKRQREGRLAITTPLVAMLASVWAWSIYSGADPLVRYMVPALHSLQYVYMVWLLKRNEAREREGPPWFERAAATRVGILAVSALALGWLLFHGAPWTLDDVFGPRGRERFLDLGATPYFAALYALVNMHHYFMDNVIWRKEYPETRYLRDARPAPEPMMGDEVPMQLVSPRP